MSERDLQKAVAEYLDLRGWRWFHYTAEGKRSPKYGAHLKKQGAKKGVPDVLIFEWWTAPVPCVLDARETGPGIAIELKVGKPGTKYGDPTPEQQDWLDALRERGWHTAVCRSHNEVIELCERLLR